MVRIGELAPTFRLDGLDGSPAAYAAEGRTTLLVFFETDCPACQLALPYLDRMAQAVGPKGQVIGVSQNDEPLTRALVQQAGIHFPILLDRALDASTLYDPQGVPAMFLLDAEGHLVDARSGFDKDALNEIAAHMCRATGIDPMTIAPAHDGAPVSKPGCTSRHRWPADKASDAPSDDDASGDDFLYARRGRRASRIEVPAGADVEDCCRSAGFGDPLPVMPPTVERVERMLAATSLPADEVIGRIPPNYGPATVEKIAANAVMAGCDPPMMRVLVPLVRAACDERFNLHGVQATTHFAAPLVIVNGPVRGELGFACGQNVFSNVARANSTLGRALQLMLLNLGGARPTDIDMSTLGNAGKFCSCIAENEEQNPWEPLHVDKGLSAGQSALTLMAAEPPRGVSEHNARRGHTILRAISWALATVWTHRQCMAVDALVVLCPEHVHTLARDGYTKQAVRETLYQITGVPCRLYDDEGEGTQYAVMYEQVTIDGEACYRKFRSADAIEIVVAGGTAGKFSAVIGSWAAGPRGSQAVTYPIDAATQTTLMH